jgi:hypothetical protein
MILSAFYLKIQKRKNFDKNYFLIRSEKPDSFTLRSTEEEALTAFRAITNQVLVVSHVSLPTETFENKEV